MVWNIIKLSWKNVWRNPTRSGVVIIAVVLGIWAGVFISAFFNGMAEGYLDNQFRLSVPHIKITEPQFEDLNSPEYYIPESDRVLNKLQQKSYIESIRTESLTTGLAQSSHNNFGVSIHGIRSQSNQPITKYLQKGTMPGASSKSNGVIIGKKLANRLQLQLGSRMVLSFQDTNGEITGGAFRVAGIFDTFSDPYDKGNVFVNRSDLNRLLGLKKQIHTMWITLSNFEQADDYASQLGSQFPNLQIKAWGETSPDLRLMFAMTDMMTYIIMIIVIIALVFSIINTMLMAVLERTRELGMLRAVGMNKPRVFSMIVWETLFLTMMGTPVGLLLSWLTVSHFEDAGINLSAFSQGLSAYGFGTTIYPELPSIYYLNIGALIALAALLSALYPAWKTLQLNPVEAIQKFN